MSIKTRVRATSEAFVGDAEVQHQRHRARGIREVASQLDVPTLLTPASSHLLRFHFVCCAEKVSKLINRPVVSLLGTRVGGTSAEVVTKSIELELFATTSGERLLSNYRDQGAHGRGKECLPETSRPGLISTMRPDLPQPTHRLEPQDTLGGDRLSSQDGVFQQQQAALLSIPQLNRLIEADIVRDENSASNAAVTATPSQHRVTLQILSHWQPFRDLKLMFAGSRRAEQLSLHSQQRIVATVEDSVLG